MNQEMFDAAQPYLATAQDAGNRHGAQGEPATGTHSRPVETPVSRTSVDPGVPAPPIPCVGVGDVAAHLPPGSTNSPMTSERFCDLQGWSHQPLNLKAAAQIIEAMGLQDVGSEDMEVPVAVPPVAVEPPAAPSDPTTHVSKDRSGDLGGEGGGESAAGSADRHAASTHLPDIARQEVDRVRQRASLTALHKALKLLEVDSDRLAEAGDLPTLADGLAKLRSFRQAASNAERRIEDHVAQLMLEGRDEDEVPALLTKNFHDELILQRRRGKDRKQWQSLELLRALVGDQLVNAQTGEDVTDRLVACLPLTPSLSWRAGALREAGFDPDEWCESSPARTTVRVTTREGES